MTLRKQIESRDRAIKAWKKEELQYIEMEKEHLAKIEKMENHQEWLSDGWNKSSDRCLALKKDYDLAIEHGAEFSSKLATLQQSIEDAPRVWYSHKSERALRCGQMYSDRVMIDQGWVKVALLELKDGE